MKTSAEYATKQRQAIMTMQRAGEAAALNGVSDMSSEEINDEIQVVRNGRHNWEEKEENMIPVSRFHKGEAEKIIEEVEKAGMGFVIEDGKCVCVLLSLERYELIMEILERKQ